MQTHWRISLFDFTQAWIETLLLLFGDQVLYCVCGFDDQVVEGQIKEVENEGLYLIETLKEDRLGETRVQLPQSGARVKVVGNA